MSKITNDNLPQSGTECFIAAVPIRQVGNSGRQRVKNTLAGILGHPAMHTCIKLTTTMTTHVSRRGLSASQLTDMERNG